MRECLLPSGSVQYSEFLYLCQAMAILRFLSTIIFTFIFLLGYSVPHCAGQGDGKYYFDFNDRCKQAYQSLVSLRIAEGGNLLAEELREHPDNLVPVMLANYDDCLTLLFNGDAKEYARRKGNLDKRVKLLEQSDPNSPWYRFSVGLLYFQWAAVRIRFKEDFTAGVEFRKSFLLLKENSKRFPEFRNNQVLLGVEEALVGTIPDSYRWITSMLGMKGSVKRGTAQIVDFLSHRDGTASLMREEAIFYYCYLKFSLLSDRKATWKYLDESALDFRNNHLFAFMKANFALNDNKAAIAEQTLRQRNTSSAYLDAPIFDYQMGITMLQKNDDDCLVYFQRFLNQNKGNLFVKDALQKMSLYCIAAGNLPKAITYKNKIKAVGTAKIDADKQAQRYAENDVIPNTFLLRARLLCDGGYFSKALEQLKGFSARDFPQAADQLEFHYRQARIYSLMGQPAKAIPYYEATIKMGHNRQEHFAARSALELGEIFEDQGKRTEAVAYYKKCIAMKNHDYKSSLDQKAKAGINRLGAGG